MSEERVFKYLVHYLRDCYRIPFGCIVAVSPDNIGVSVCCPKDHFNKKRAREVALGRALIRSDSLEVVPNRMVCGYYGDDNDRTFYQEAVPMKDYVEESIKWFKVRVNKYFQKLEQ